MAQVQLVQVDWAAVTRQIIAVVDPYFNDPLSAQIDDSVQNLFVPTIRQYTNVFLGLEHAFARVQASSDANTATLAFLCVFEPVAFKIFVINALGNVAEKLNAPISELTITAVLKSTLGLQENGIMIRVAENNFAVLATFIATFFSNK